MDRGVGQCALSGMHELWLPQSEEESLNITDTALEQGINFLDAATVYNRRRSEEIIGKALKRKGKPSL